jgi:hypothetical protein
MCEISPNLVTLRGILHEITNFIVSVTSYPGNTLKNMVMLLCKLTKHALFVLFEMRNECVFLKYAYYRWPVFSKIYHPRSRVTRLGEG